MKAALNNYARPLSIFFTSYCKLVTVLTIYFKKIISNVTKHRKQISKLQYTH